MRVILCLSLLLATVIVEAATQSVRTRLGEINLRSDLALATPIDPESEQQDFDDEVLLIVHDTFVTGRYPEIVRLRNRLQEEFISTLAITLSYGQNYRRRDRDIKCIGLHAHRHEDALEELAAWFQFLVRRGTRSIFLAGYGRGANQVALFAQTQPSPFLQGLILIDPLVATENTRQDEYTKYDQNISQVRQQAARMLPSATINEIPFLGCPPHPDTLVTGGAFISYYSDNANLNTMFLLQDIDVRSLLVLSQAQQASIDTDIDNEMLRTLSLQPQDQLEGYEFNELIQEIIEFMDFY